MVMTPVRSYSAFVPNALVALAASQVAREVYPSNIFHKMFVYSGARLSFSKTWSHQNLSALRMGRRSRSEQEEQDDPQSPAQSHHRLPSSAVARLTLTRSCAPYVRATDDLVLAGLVGETVADLKLHREDATQGCR
jgi:hypothetical protein